MLLAAAPIVASAPSHAVALDDLGGILVVKAMVNGRGPFNFVLDTGAGTTVITPELAATLGVAGKGSTVANGTGAKSVAVKTLVLDRVTVGDAAQSNVAAAMIPLPLDLTDQGSYGHIDGILGYSFLQHYVVTMNIADGQVTFARAGAAASSVLPLAVNLSGHVPVIAARVDGRLGQFEIDSGNNSVAILTQAFSQANGIERRYRSASTSQYEGVGGKVRTSQVRVGSASLGTVTLHDVVADISSAHGGALAHLDGNFGYDVLRRFVVTLDYPRSQLYLEPLSDYDSYRSDSGTGMTIERAADGNFAIVSVAAGTPAERAGIKSGDIIVAVNGRSAPQLSDGDYAKAVGTKPGHAVTLTLKTTSAQTRSITLVTVDLLPPLGTNRAR